MSKSVPFKTEKFNSKYALYIKIRTFKCQLGEYYISVDGTDDGRCATCEPGQNTFSVSPDSIQCTGIDKKLMDEVNPYQIKVR
jgi:hypothetical protein